MQKKKHKKNEKGMKESYLYGVISCQMRIKKKQKQKQNKIKRIVKKT